MALSSLSDFVSGSKTTSYYFNNHSNFRGELLLKYSLISQFKLEAEVKMGQTDLSIMLSFSSYLMEKEKKKRGKKRSKEKTVFFF